MHPSIQSWAPWRLTVLRNRIIIPRVIIFTLYPLHSRFVRQTIATAEILSLLVLASGLAAAESSKVGLPASSSSIRHRNWSEGKQLVDSLYLYHHWVEVAGCCNQCARLACEIVHLNKKVTVEGDLSHYSPLTLSETFFDVSRAHRIISVLKTRKHLADTVNNGEQSCCS